MKCQECSGELKPKVEFFKQGNPDRFKEFQKKAKKEFGFDLPEPKGYNCIECCACYNEKFERERCNICWSGNDNTTQES